MLCISFPSYHKEGRESGLTQLTILLGLKWAPDSRLLCRREHAVWNEKAWVQLLALLPGSCKILSWLINPPKPQFPNM